MNKKKANNNNDDNNDKNEITNLMTMMTDEIEDRDVVFGNSQYAHFF